jgi:hypothetical protein
MKALISPNEKVYLPDGAIGERVAWVCEAEYPSAPPLFWVDCADDVVPDIWYYDPQDQQIKLRPDITNEPQT